MKCVSIMEFRDKDRSILQHIVFGICITPIILLFIAFGFMFGYIIYEKVLMDFDIEFILNGVVFGIKSIGVLCVIGFGLIYGGFKNE